MSKQSTNKDCPVCGKPMVKNHAPFCSSRCKDVDLNRWLSGGYAIPGNPSEDDSEGVPDSESLDDMADNSTDGRTRH